MSRSKVHRSAGKLRRQAARRERRRLAAILDAPRAAYGQAIVSGWYTIMATEHGIDLQRVVCEHCGLEQEYLTADNFEQDELDVYPCPGPLDLECGSELCWSAERYLEAA